MLLWKEFLTAAKSSEITDKSQAHRCCSRNQEKSNIIIRFIHPLQWRRYSRNIHKSTMNNPCNENNDNTFHLHNFLAELSGIDEFRNGLRDLWNLVHFNNWRQNKLIIIIRFRSIHTTPDPPFAQLLLPQLFTNIPWAQLFGTGQPPKGTGGQRCSGRDETNLNKIKNAIVMFLVFHHILRLKCHKVIKEKGTYPRWTRYIKPMTHIKMKAFRLEFILVTVHWTIFKLRLLFLLTVEL